MSRPDFSGTWRFNPSKSRLQIPLPESTVFVIDHREPHFHLERTHVFGETSDTFVIDLTTDGQTVRKSHRDVQILARLYWDAQALVFNSHVIRGNEKGTNIVRYQLADQGRTFIALEELSLPDHKHTNTWVFDRQ